MLKHKSISTLLLTSLLAIGIGSTSLSANAYLYPNQFYNYVNAILVKNKIDLLPSNVLDNPRVITGVNIPKTKFTKNSIMVHRGAIGIEYFVGKKSKQVYGVITTINLNYVPRVPYAYINKDQAYQLALVNAATLNRKDDFNVAYPVMVKLYRDGIKQYQQTHKPVALKVEDYNKQGYDYEFYIQPYRGTMLLQTRAFRNIFKYQTPVSNNDNK